MNKTLEEILFMKFPNLYSRGLDFGFQCNDGWFLLLWHLSAKLEPLGVTVSQAKQKFGNLRVYLDYNKRPSADAYALIQGTEQSSKTTCEDCGQPGELSELYHWWATLCKPCYNMRKERRGHAHP